MSEPKFPRALSRTAFFGVAKAMHHEITADSLLTLASPNVAGIAMDVAHTKDGWLSVRPDQLNNLIDADGLTFPEFDPSSARGLVHINSVPALVVNPEHNADMAGIIELKKALRELELGAMRHLFSLGRKIEGDSGTFRGWVMRKLIGKIVIRAFACAASNLYAHVLGPKANKHEHRMICTGKKEWIEGRNFQNGGTFYSDYNGHLGFKRRRGRPALSAREWQIRKSIRYHLHKKTSAKRRVRVTGKNGRKRWVNRQPAFKTPPTKYGRPKLGRAKRKRGNLFERVKAKVLERIPYKWEFWTEGAEYWKEVFIDGTWHTIQHEVEHEVRHEIKHGTKEFTEYVMEHVVFPAGRAVKKEITVRIVQPLPEWWDSDRQILP